MVTEAIPIEVPTTISDISDYIAMENEISFNLDDESILEVQESPDIKSSNKETIVDNNVKNESEVTTILDALVDEVRKNENEDRNMETNSVQIEQTTIEAEEVTEKVENTDGLVAGLHPGGAIPVPEGFMPETVRNIISHKKFFANIIL